MVNVQLQCVVVVVVSHGLTDFKFVLVVVWLFLLLFLLLLEHWNIGTLEHSGTVDRKQVDIKQSGRTGRTHVPDAVNVPVQTCQEATTVLRNGLNQRKTASHAMNVHSSRSHVIVHVKCVVTRSDGTRAFGQLFLVDLAGSEQIKKSEGTFNAVCFFLYWRFCALIVY